MNDDLTTLICLFHHRDQAQAAIEDVLDANVPEADLTLLESDGSNKTRTSSNGSAAEILTRLGVPQQQRTHLLTGLEGGGVVLAVSSLSHLAGKVEAIFEARRAGLVATSETERFHRVASREPVADSRTVGTQSVRVYPRLIEMPAEEPGTPGALAPSSPLRSTQPEGTQQPERFADDHVIELIETREELLVSKNAHVIEEIVVGKQTSERRERIRNTVRRTEVEVQELAPGERFSPGAAEMHRGDRGD